MDEVRIGVAGVTRVALGRRRREFGAAVLRFAAAHHRHTEVIGKHWAEPATTQEMPWA
jgi:hypothetical protein